MSIGAEASRGRLIYKAESAYAEVPASNPATTRIRFNSESLHHKNVTVISDELRSDRQRTDAVLTAYDVDGDFTSELSYGNFDWLIEAALCGTWSTLAGTVADGATTSGSAVVTSATAAFTANDKFKSIAGTGIPANSYIGVVTNATTIGLSSSPTTNTPVNATATATGLTLTIGSVGVPRGGYVTNGIVNRSFLLERGYMDIDEYVSFRGTVINTLNLDVTSRKIVMLTAGIMAAHGYPLTTSVAGTTVPTEPNANSPITAGKLINLMNSGSSNHELDGISTKEIKLNINNNLRVRDVATELETVDPGRGVMDIGVSFNAYFNDRTILDDFVTNQFFAVQFALTDPIENRFSYIVTLPRMKLTDVNAPIGGIDTDIMMPITARAFVDATLGYSVRVDRGATVVT